MQTPTLTDKLRSVIRRVTVSNSLMKKPQRIWKWTTLSANFQINFGFQLSTFLRHYLKKKLPFKGRILHLRWFKLSTSFFSMLRQYSAWHKKEAFCITKVNFVADRILTKLFYMLKTARSPLSLYEATHFSFSSETPGFKRKSSLSLIIFSSHLPANRP